MKKRLTAFCNVGAAVMLSMTVLAACEKSAPQSSSGTGTTSPSTQQQSSEEATEDVSQLSSEAPETQIITSVSSMQTSVSRPTAYRTNKNEVVYFKENFSNYTTFAPGVVPDYAAKGISVGNDPIWVNHAELNVRPPKDIKPFDIFAKDIALPNVKSVDMQFKFRFMNGKMPVPAKPEVKDKNGKVTKTAVAAVPGVAKSFVFRVNSTPITISADKVEVQGKSYAIPFIANWTWVNAAVSVRNGKMTIYVSNDRKLRKVAEIPFGAPVSKANFGAIADNHFGIYDISFTDGGKLEDHPVEKHFASFKSLEQAIPSGAVKKDLTIKPDAKSGFCGFKIVLNKPDAPVKMMVHWSNGVKWPHQIFAKGEKTTLMAPVNGLDRGATMEIPDAFIKVDGFGVQWVRPLLQRYCSSYDCEPQYIDILREWNKLPSASKHVLTVCFVSEKSGALQVYFDGSYVTTIRRPEKDLKGGEQVTAETKLAKLVKIELIGNGMAQFLPLNGKYDKVPSKYRVLDMSANPRAKAFADGKLSLKPGLQTIDGVQFDVAAPIDSADIAICKQGKGNWALEVEEYHARSPQDNLPSSVHYRVPAAPYTTAHLLVALDPDSSKDSVLTIRLGHYQYPGTGSNTQGAVTLDLRDGKIPANFKQVGTVTRNGKAIPLYKVSVPLNLGRILDIAARESYLDVDFTGKQWVNFEQLDNTMKPDPNSDSSFNLFGITLEQAPVVMDFKQASPGNVFTEDEKALTTVTLKAISPSNGTISWTAKDIAGKAVFNGSKPFNLTKAGATAEIVIPLKAEVGYYDLDVSLNCKGIAPLIHNARFAILAKDNRTWSPIDSPYATWWFTAHGSPGEMDIGGPMMMKAGIRKSTNYPTPEARKKYKINNSPACYAPSMRDFDANTGHFKEMTIEVPDPKDPKRKIKQKFSGEEAFVQKVKSTMKPDGYYDHIMVWHESAPGYGIPEEVLNMPLPESAKEQMEKDKAIAAYVNEVGRLTRKYFPNLKIQLGNSSSGIGAAVRPLRAGADPQYYDQIGIETPSQVIMPEKMQECAFQGMQITRDVANVLAKGRKDIKLNGCYEFIYRCERDMGEQQQAEWYTRDTLISLANNFSFISIGLLFDCRNGYYNGLWGGSGLITRAPYVYPKRAYVAYAALTSALDNVKFHRQLDTGSTTVYALEFKRKDGTYAYAFWSARGTFTLEADNGANADRCALFTAFYGRQTKLSGKTLTLNCGTAPVYLNTKKPLGGIKVVKRTFPEEEARAAKSIVGSSLDDATKVVLAPDPMMTSTRTSFLPILKPGKFTVETVTDAEKGRALKVTLDKSTDPYKSKYITEFTTIRLTEPMPVSGNVDAVGIWVKGNSNWAQIRFEIEDAQGEVFKGITTDGWGCDVYDWPGNTCINFDGWCYVAQPLWETKLFNNHSPGPASEQWISCGGDKKIDLPIKVRAVTIGIYRHKLDLFDFKETEPSILLKDFGGVKE